MTFKKESKTMLDGNKKGTTGHCLKFRKTRCTSDIIEHFSNNKSIQRREDKYTYT